MSDACTHSQRNRSRRLKSTLGPCTRCPARTPDCWPPPGLSARWAFPLWPPPIFQLKQRQRGFDEAQYLEAIVLLQTAGGDCPEDMQLLGNDSCLERGLGFALPKVSAVRGFLERFHDEDLEQSRPPRAVQKSFIVPSSAPVEGLQAVQAGVVRRIAQLYAEQQTALRIATVDQDATIIESHKAAAQAHYEGGRGYQPMVAVWAEADLVLADEFRDGNVPARQEPLTCAQLAFAALAG